MKFLLDVHLSFKLMNALIDLGYSSIHVNDILDKWFTKDNDICKFADINDYIVMTKDSDFRNSFFLSHTPKKLIKINLGNISNQKLIDIFKENIFDFEKINTNHKCFMIEIDVNNVQYLSLD